MSWQDRIVLDPAILTGKPTVKGTRISVEFVVDLLARGWTQEDIIREYDHLTPADIQACLAYASDMLQSGRAYVATSLEGDLTQDLDAIYAVMDLRSQVILRREFIRTDSFDVQHLDV